MTGQILSNGHGAQAQVPAREQVTCSNCGTVGMLTPNRRDSTDFCVKCDYPLFWVPSRIVLDASTTADGSLRRLPGTVGRATIASLVCPHCAENNAPSAELCVRCGKPLRPVAPPPPVPVYVPPPPLPEPVYEPVRRTTPWWVWALLVLAVVGALAAVAVIVYVS
jgi:hypothetical protein